MYSPYFLVSKMLKPQEYSLISTSNFGKNCMKTKLSKIKKNNEVIFKIYFRKIRKHDLCICI